MKTKMRVLLHSMWYPLAMASYWRRAFQRRTDADLKVVGQYTGSWIPWNGGMDLPVKYAIPPDVITGGKDALNRPIPWDMVEFQLGGWKPDIIITVDAMCNWIDKPTVGCPVVTIGTDAHCLQDWYNSKARKVSDYFFNMHEHYAVEGDYILPYAFDPEAHYPMMVPKTHDAVCIGMAYKHRTDLVNAVRATGATVIYENGPVFDEYRRLNNSARIGLNIASSQDLNARVFELMAMGLCPVVNKVPDLDKHFTEGVEYVGFETIEEAAYKVKMLLQSPEAIASISSQAQDSVWRPGSSGNPIHSYDQRVHDLLDTVGML